jgi:hypothetical protein
MRSRDNTLRVHLERALRALALTALAFAAWSAAQPEPEPAADDTGHAGLGDALDRWTTAPAGRIHLTLERTLRPGDRDWIRALRRAGTPVTWESNGIPALAIEAAPLADPRGGAMIWVVAPAGQRVAVSDAIAPLDTVVAQAGGAMLGTPIGVGPFEVRIEDHAATAEVRDTILPRRVLVIGPATWEAKFVITALEEAGWGIDARLGLAPGVEVTQGAAGAPDTAHHAAVVALGAPSAGLGRAIARYVRAGGGLLLAGESAEAAAFAELAAGRPGTRARPATLSFAEGAPRRALAFRAVAPRTDALVLEEQGGRVVVAARRWQSGRVIQLGYEDTWRWRLGGGASAVAAHRDWWSGLVSAVAHRATTPAVRASPNEAAPMAALVTALGPPISDAMPGSVGGRWVPSPVLLFSMIIALLLGEIASRRLRGAP